MEKEKKSISICGYIKGVYNWLIKLLANHKKPALFLSHGGLHLLVFFACLAGAYFIYTIVQGYNQQTMRQFSMRIEGDTLNNYLLSHVSIHHVLKAESEKGRSPMEGINYHFKYGRRNTTNLHTIPSRIGPYGDCDVDVVQKMTFITVDSSYVSSVPQGGEGFISPEKLDKHHTSKIKGVYFPSKLQTIYYNQFTTNDSIKEDEVEIIEPNLTNMWEDKNPYFCAFIGIHAVQGSYDLDSTSIILIQYNFYPYKEAPNSYKTENDLFPEAPMTIESVLPVPTEMTVENLIYKGKDVERVFEQGGIYFTAVDPIKKAHADRMEFLLTVVIGTILAFALDIVVQLVLKWRKLKYENKI